jgi:uncharacterized BrkB/YihY/UPF0761 family membrane protein
MTPPRWQRWRSLARDAPWRDWQWLRLPRRVLHEARADGITGEAAKVAYYFFLSLFPMILALFAFTGIVGGNEAFRWTMRHLRQALPGDAADYLARFVHEVTGRAGPACSRSACC